MNKAGKTQAAVVHISEHDAELISMAPMRTGESVYVEFPSRRGLGFIMVPATITKMDDGSTTSGKLTWVLQVEFHSRQLRLPERIGEQSDGVPQQEKPRDPPGPVRCALYVAGE